MARFSDMKKTKVKETPREKHIREFLKNHPITIRYPALWRDRDESTNRR